MKKKIVLLGSTGSIGKSFLDIVKKDKKNCDILLLSVNRNINELLKQLKIFKVRNIVVREKKSFLKIKKILKNKKINIYNNYDSIHKIFNKKKDDYILNAISGLDGLSPTLKTIRFTKNIAIANKESIICGWSLIKKELDKFKVKFARYVAELASEMPDDQEVPEYFVENELRDWVNKKFLIDPPLPPKVLKNETPN